MGNRKRRLLSLKLVAFLSIIRWYNILLVILSQFFTAIFIINTEDRLVHILTDKKLYYTVLATALVVAAGFIINAFYDLEKDLVNQPRQTLFHRIVSRAFSLNVYIAFNALGVGLAYFVSREMMAFFLVYSVALWLYSHKLNKTALIGNIATSIAMVAPFFAICIYYHTINWVIVLYVSFIALIQLIRDLVKNLELVKGDLIYNYQTLPVKYGVTTTKWIVIFLMSLSIIPPALLSFLSPPAYIFIYYGTSILLIIGAALMLLPSNQQQHFSRINTILKMILVFGILCIPLASERFLF